MTFIKGGPTLLAALLALGVAMAGPLQEAAREGDTARVRQLVTQGADLEAKDDEAATALHWAAYYDYSEIGRLLLEAGADVDSHTIHNRTPLHIAAMRGSIAVAGLLIDNGAKIDALDDEPTSPLALAVVTGELSMVELLLARGADVNLKLAGGTTVLQGGLVNSQHNREVRGELCELLVRNGADVQNVTVKERSTPLHSSAVWGCADCVEVLIAHGADVEAKNSFGQRPLHNAAATGQARIVRLLIAEGADVNARDEKGLTPLHWASMKGRLPRFLADWGFRHADMVPNKDYRTTIELLVSAGADVHAESEKGRTPLALAKKSKNRDIVGLLQRYVAD